MKENDENRGPNVSIFLPQIFCLNLLVPAEGRAKSSAVKFIREPA